MKKLVVLFLSVLTSGLLLTSCSDDDGDSGSIEGKWEFYQEGFSFGGAEQLELYEHTAGCEKDFIDLKSGGNYEEVTYFNNGESCQDDIGTGTWSRSGNTISITFDGETFDGTIVTLNNTTLKVSITEDFEGVAVTAIVVFKRP